MDDDDDNDDDDDDDDDEVNRREKWEGRHFASKLRWKENLAQSKHCFPSLHHHPHHHRH